MGFSLRYRTRNFMVAVALDRRHRDFREDDKLLIELLRPHLLQAYRNAEAMAQLRADAARTAQVLDTLREGVLTVSATGRIRFTTGRVRACLARFFGPSRGSSQMLPDTLLRWFHAQLVGTRNGGAVAAPRTPLAVERSEARLTVRLLTDHEPGEYLLMLEERRIQDPLTMLRGLGLTPREAEVLSWIAQGKTNAETGIILGLSAGTVHKHLEHIFEKLGVETRTAAAACAMEVLHGQA